MAFFQLVLYIYEGIKHVIEAKKKKIGQEDRKYNLLSCNTKVRIIKLEK